MSVAITTEHSIEIFHIYLCNIIKGMGYGIGLCYGGLIHISSMKHPNTTSRSEFK